MPSGPVAAAIVLAIAVLIGGVYLFLELRHHGRSRDRHRAGERLPLFGTDLLVERGTTGSERPPLRASPVQRPAPPMERPTFAPPPARAPEHTSSNGHGGASPAVTAEFAAPVGGGAATAGRPVREPGAAMPMRSAFAGQQTTGVMAPHPGPFGAPAFQEGETIRFSIPDEGTLQFLPGRLEVVGGADRGREVRFVRTPGESRPEVTFGRSEGPNYRHVQLLARTVSRHHATMSLLDGHWQLTNMSDTNPVLLNGRSLAAGEIAPLLVDGDRIEMGEVVFVFHER